MARRVSAAVDVRDLEFVTEHLVRLSYSTPRALRDRASVGDNISLCEYRRQILRIADSVEVLADEAHLNYPPKDFCCRVDQARADLQAVILKTLKPEAMKRMRVSIRQKRHQNRGWPHDVILRTYEAAQLAEKKAAEDQAELDL